MRLTCPNCDAQYEVPDEVIPPEGRDVQCSNCGDTWYQTGSNSAQASTPEDASAAGPSQDPQPEQPSEDSEEEAIWQPDTEQAQENADDDLQPSPETPVAMPESTPETEPDVGPDPDPDLAPQVEQVVQPVEEDPTEAPAQSGLARGMDPSVTGILREEAEREAKLRAAEGTGLESQPDLGLATAIDDEPSRRANQARDRMARLKGENPALLAAAESGSRRGLLPDIDEINSTLRANSDPAGQVSVAPEAEHPPRRKSGFSRGFAIVILLVLALVLTYTNAPQIAEVLPQADPFLSSYVAWVDQTRLWLDAKASGFQPGQ